MTTLESVGKMIERAGFQADSICRSVIHRTPEPGWRTALELSNEEKVVEILRERRADLHTVAVSLTIFPEQLVHDGFDQGISGSIFENLEHRFDRVVHYAVTRILAPNPNSTQDKRIIEQLNSPTVLLEQLHFDSNDVPVFLSLDYILTQEMKLTIRRERI